MCERVGSRAPESVDHTVVGCIPGVLCLNLLWFPPASKSLKHLERQAGKWHNDRHWDQTHLGLSSGLTPFHGKHFVQALALSIHFECPRAPWSVHLFVRPELTQPERPSGAGRPGSRWLLSPSWAADCSEELGALSKETAVN